MEQQGEKIALNDLFIPISVLQNLVKETDIPKKIIEEEHSELFFETLSGSGKIQLENNTSYTGNMRFGIFDSGSDNVPCTLVFSDGTQYEGEIHNNQITGHGKYTFVTGAIYEGELLNGLRHGYGEYTSQDGTKYQGNWSNGLKNGMGKQINATMTYEGEWKDGFIEGNGKMTWASGCEYEGEFKNTQINGNGFMIWLNKKEKYTGQWVNNLQDGKGVYTWYEGKNDFKNFNNRFVGEWKKGKRNGYGVFYYTNGTKYEGIWRDNKKDGFGIFTFQDGTEYIGLFKMDVMVDINSQISLEKIEGEIAAAIQALKPVVTSPRRFKDITKEKSGNIKKFPKPLLEAIVEDLTNVQKVSSNNNNKPQQTQQGQSLQQTQAQGQTQQQQMTTQSTEQSQILTQSQTKPIKKSVKEQYDKSLNSFEIYLNTNELNKLSPEIGASIQEVNNLLLRNLSEIKRWYVFSFRPEINETEEVKEKKDTLSIIPNGIYSNNLAYGMELKDLWRFLRETGTISPSFSIADFNQVFFNQYNNYTEMFFVPEECEGSDIYEFLYQKIALEKRLFADHYSIFTGYYLPKDLSNTSLNYLKESESKSNNKQEGKQFLNIDKTHEINISRSIHNEQQIVLLRQFYDALIRCAYIKNHSKSNTDTNGNTTTIPFSQKFKDYLLECSASKPHLKRGLRDNKSTVSRLESSFLQKELKQNMEIVKAKNMEYLMIDEFFDTYKKHLTPIFNKLYFNSTDTANPNKMSIPYRFFYNKIIQKSKIFKEIGINKLAFAEFLIFFHKDKKKLSAEEFQSNPIEWFIYIEELFDNTFIFFEFSELVFFLTRKYIVRKRLKEEDNEEHSLEVINHIWSLVKGEKDRTRGRKVYCYPDNDIHGEIERLMQEQRDYEDMLAIKNKEIERYNIERSKMGEEDCNAYIPDMDEEEEYSEEDDLQ